jgi:hypothetical protein
MIREMDTRPVSQEPSCVSLDYCFPHATLYYKELGGDSIWRLRAAVGGIMRKWLRRIRGTIGIGLAWGFAWSLVGSIPRWVFGFNTDAPLPIIFGTLGFVAGVIFSALLAVTESGRGFDQLSLPRFAAWGALGGLLLSGIFAFAASLGLADVLAIIPTFVVASAACACGSLVLARRAGWGGLLDGRGGADAALSERRKQQLGRGD